MRDGWQIAKINEKKKTHTQLSWNSLCYHKTLVHRVNLLELSMSIYYCWCVCVTMIVCLSLWLWLAWRKSVYQAAGGGGAPWSKGFRVGSPKIATGLGVRLGEGGADLPIIQPSLSAAKNDQPRLQCQLRNRIFGCYEFYANKRFISESELSELWWKELF